MNVDIWMRIVDFGLVIVMVMVQGHKITKATQTFLQKTRALKFTMILDRLSARGVVVGGVSLHKWSSM